MAVPTQLVCTISPRLRCIRGKMLTGPKEEEEGEEEEEEEEEE
jgi:hypothetical protein